MALPIGAIAGIGQAALGIGQMLFSGAGKAQRDLEKLVNSYKPNASINDYYQKALNKYSANPYTSNLYNQQTRNINRNVNAGIGALQNRRMGLAGITSLVQGQNDAYLKAAGAAEQQQGQALSQLGQATQIKAAEDFKPFEMKYNLAALKASGRQKTLGAGIQNLFGGFGSFGDAMAGTSGSKTTGGAWQSDGRGFNSRGYATGVY